jgi:hypothetical protein
MSGGNYSDALGASDPLAALVAQNADPRTNRTILSYRHGNKTNLDERHSNCLALPLE